MKHKFIYTILFLLLGGVVNSQIPQGIQYQIIVRADNDDPVVEQNVELTVEILQGSLSGTVVFSELHTVRTTGTGAAIFTIGSLENGVGSINDIEWGDEEYFLQVKNESTILSTEKVLVVPFVKFVETAKTAKHISYDALDSLPNYFDGDYESLSENLPRIITSEEQAKIDFIEISKEVDIQSVKSEDSVASLSVGTPEFGRESKTIVEGNTVWKSVDGNMIHDGNVGVNVPIPSDFGGAGMMVNGAIMYDGVPVEPSPGMLFYDPSVNNGSFCYFNENLEKVILGTGVLEGGGIYNDGYKVFMIHNYNDGLIIDKSIVVGNAASIERNSNDYTMVIASNIILMKFHDTSNSASFPSRDWQIKTNDIEEGGDNYFSFVDVDYGRIPFKIEAGAEDHSIYLTESDKMGFGTNLPTEKLDVDGVVKGSSFIGDGSQLTGISTRGTETVSNSGSTTIRADDNSDNIGQIEFTTKDTNRVIIDSQGNVGLDTVPEYALDVNGTASFQNLIVGGNMKSKGISYPVYKETITTSGFYGFDVTDKTVVVLNPTGGNITLFISPPESFGKEIIVINESPTHSVSFYQTVGPGGVPFSLGQYESVKLIFNSSWFVTNLVQAP